MTAHDEAVFAQGMLLGTAMTLYELQRAFTEMDKRVGRTTKPCLRKACNETRCVGLVEPSTVVAGAKPERGFAPVQP
jgi:hypothetical protein